MASTRRFDETVVAKSIKILPPLFANQGLIKVFGRLQVMTGASVLPNFRLFYAALAGRDDGTANSPQVLESRGVEPARIEFKHRLLATHGVALILTALGARRDRPEPGPAFRRLRRQCDAPDELLTLEDVVVVRRPFTITISRGACKCQ